MLIGEEAVMDAPGQADREIWAAVRPEGFILAEDGALTCKLDRVEVMGRDVSVVSTHPAMTGNNIRSIISAELAGGVSGSTVRFHLKPSKVFLFEKQSEERIRL